MNMKLNDPMSTSREWLIGFLDVAFSIWTGVFTLFLVLILPYEGKMEFTEMIIMLIGLANLPIFAWRLIKKDNYEIYMLIALGAAIFTFIIMFTYALIYIFSTAGPGF